MNLLWRSCSHNQLSKALGSGFRQARRVHSLDSSKDVQYQLFAQPKFRTHLLGLVSIEQRQREFVHLVTQSPEDFDHAMTSFVSGSATPRSDWQFAKFKIVLRSCGEVHRVVLVRRANEEAKPEMEAVAGCLIQGLSCSQSLDLDAWATTLHSMTSSATAAYKSPRSSAGSRPKHSPKEQQHIADTHSHDWHAQAESEPSSLGNSCRSSLNACLSAW